MSVWLWVNLGLGALFVLAIVGIPLWLVVRHPDTRPALADRPSQRGARERQASGAMPRQPAAEPWVPRQAAARQWRARQPVGERWSPAADN